VLVCVLELNPWSLLGDEGGERRREVRDLEAGELRSWCRGRDVYVKALWRGWPALLLVTQLIYVNLEIQKGKRKIYT
jgi:hypothetical protein